LLRFLPALFRPGDALLARPWSTSRLTTPPAGLAMPRLIPSEPMPGLAATAATEGDMESSDDQEPDLGRRNAPAMMREAGVLGVVGVDDKASLVGCLMGGEGGGGFLSCCETEDARRVIGIWRGSGAGEEDEGIFVAEAS
ncbi:hypothetical protein GP486_003780, partial [Trichoglossum hirsutum]